MVGEKDRKREREQEENGEFVDSDDDDSEFASWLVTVSRLYPSARVFYAPLFF